MADFAEQLRSRSRTIGYWMASGDPAATERIARVGYDFVCLDLQHGLMDEGKAHQALVAVDAGGSNGIIRVRSNDASLIGRALDAGARAVIVPLVNSPAEAEQAARACRYPPLGIRSFGPIRSSLRVGPLPGQANRSVACIVMVETAAALESLDEICSVDGVDGVYVGPADLALALGADDPQEGPSMPEFKEALARVIDVAKRAGIAAGLHCYAGDGASEALSAGFTFVCLSNDLNHLEAAARSELARAQRPTEPLGSQR